MDRSAVITLLSITTEQDDYGVYRETETPRDVFCQVESATQREFYEGGRNGLNPEFKFTLFFGDYNEEQVVIYDGKPYSVYRTFRRKDDYVELYVERKGGTNGEESHA